MKKFTSLALTITLLALASSTAFAQAGKWATLKGQFLYGDKGAKLPAAKIIVPSKDAEVCGDTKLFEEKLVVNPENRGIANMVVWLYKHKGEVHPGYAKTAADTIKMDNKMLRFTPHTVAVRVGQTLEIGNSDPVGHNSLIGFIKNKGQNPMIPAMGSFKLGPKQIAKTEIVPSSVSCSIHPHMKGYIFVQDHPYVAVSDKDGKFEIKNIPAGKHTLRLWNGKYVEDVKIDGKKTKWSKGKYKIDIKKDEEHVYIVDPKNKAFK